jgi:hypothetical protein
VNYEKKKLSKQIVMIKETENNLFKYFDYNIKNKLNIKNAAILTPFGKIANFCGKFTFTFRKIYMFNGK